MPVLHKHDSYFGHVVRPGKLQVAEQTPKAIEGFPEPTNTTDVRSFLGLCNVFRRFVPNFARVAAPLNLMLQKGQPDKFDELTDEQKAAFNELKERLISPPILALPQPHGHYVLDTDACDKQVGCVLMQEQEGTLRPIGYWSRSLTPAEKNYDTTQREWLAVVWAILLLRPYLEMQKFTVRTDHDALR